jgi:hypothetical protein
MYGDQGSIECFVLSEVALTGDPYEVVSKGCNADTKKSDEESCTIASSPATTQSFFNNSECVPKEKPPNNAPTNKIFLYISNQIYYPHGAYVNIHKHQCEIKPGNGTKKISRCGKKT